MTAPGGNTIATVFVQVLADTRDFARKLRKDLRQSTRELRALDHEIQPVQRSLALLARTATGIAPGIRLARLGFLALASHAIVGGVVALGGALAAASGALLVLPAAGFAAASALGALTVGLFGVGDALKDFDDPEKFAAGVEKLSDNARETLGVLGSLRKEIFAFRDSVQDALFAGTADVLQDLADTFLPRLESHFSALGQVVNGAALDLAAFLQSGKSLADIDTITSNVETSFKTLRGAIIPASQALLDVTTVGSQFLPLVSAEVVKLTQRFADFIARMRATGQLEQFIAGAIAAVKQIGIILFNVGRIIVSVLGGARAAGLGLLDTLQRLTDNVADFFESARGQEQLVRFLETAREAGQALGPVLASLGDLLFNHIAPVLTSFAKTIGPAVSKFFRGLGDAITIAAPGIRAFAEGFRTFIEALIPVLPKIGELVGAIGGLAAELAAGLGPAIADVASAIASVLIPAIDALAVIVKILPDGFLKFVVVVGTVIAVIAGLIGIIRGVQTLLRLFAGGLELLAAGGVKAQGGIKGLANFLGGPWGVAIGIATTALGLLLSTSDETTSSANDLAAAMDNAKGSTEEATDAWILQKLEQDGVASTARKFRIDIQDLIDAYKGLEPAQLRVNAALFKNRDLSNASASEVRNLMDALQAGGAVVAEAEAKQRSKNEVDKESGNIVGLVTGALQLQKLAIEGVLDAQNRQQQKQLEALDAELGYFNQLERTRTELTDGALTLDIFTQEGRDNLGVLRQLAGEGARRVADLRAQGASTTAVNQLMAAQEQQLLDLLSPFFQTREAARKYAVQIGLIPSLPKTKPVFDDTQARGELQGFLSILNSITKPRTVRVTVDASFPAGGAGLIGEIAGNARGGPLPAGTWSLVGEMGPELVRFGRSARVFSTDESERMSRDVGALDQLTTRGGGGRALPTTTGGATGQLTATINVRPQVNARVYVGDREITDIVRVELDDRDRAVTQLVNVGTGRR